MRDPSTTCVGSFLAGAHPTHAHAHGVVEHVSTSLARIKMWLAAYLRPASLAGGPRNKYSKDQA
jgi:hypothetical protein